MTDEQIKDVMRFTLEEADRVAEDTRTKLLHELELHLDLWVAGYKAQREIDEMDEIISLLKKRNLEIPDSMWVVLEQHHDALWTFKQSVKAAQREEDVVLNKTPGSIYATI